MLAIGSVWYLRGLAQFRRCCDAVLEVGEERASTVASSRARTERVQVGVGEAPAKRVQHVAVVDIVECGSAVSVRTAEGIVAVLTLGRLSVSAWQEEAAGRGQGEEKGGSHLYFGRVPYN